MRGDVFSNSELGTCPFCRKRMIRGGPAGQGRVWQDCDRCRVTWDGDEIFTHKGKGSGFISVPEGTLLVVNEVSA